MLAPHLEPATPKFARARDTNQVDAIEILGSLLGGKAKAGGRGADILRDMFGGGGSAPRSQQQPQQPQSTGSIPSNTSVSANDLEDLLNVAIGRQPTGRSMPPASPPPPARTQTAPRPQPTHALLLRNINRESPRLPHPCPEVSPRLLHHTRPPASAKRIAR